MILITGAAGFIGGNFVHHWFARDAADELADRAALGAVSSTQQLSLLDYLK